MGMIKTSIVAGFALLLTTGIAGAADLDDLDVSIRVVEADDDINEVEHELSLPMHTSNSVREHHSSDRDEDASDDDSDGQDESEADEATDDHDNDTEDHDGASEEHHDADEEEKNKAIP